MITPELQTFIRQQLGSGVARDVIKQTLSAQGWVEQDINDAFFAVSSPVAAPPSVPTPIQNPVQSGSNTLKWAIVVVVLVIVGAGGTFAAYQQGLFDFLLKSTTTPSPVVAPTDTSSIPLSTDSVPAATTVPVQSDSVPVTATNNAVCNNYQCLIAAASQCQPISATISYSGIPSPFNSDMSTSGQTNYEIKKSSGVNSCTIVFSSPVTFFTLSEKGRQASLASGMTDAQITAQLQTMNDSFKLVAGKQTTCSSTGSIISTYLTDTQNGNAKFSGSGQTTTYTTSSGQKLVCTTS